MSPANSYCGGWVRHTPDPVTHQTQNTHTHPQYVCPLQPRTHAAVMAQFTAERAALAQHLEWMVNAAARLKVRRFCMRGQGWQGDCRETAFFETD